MNVRDDLVLIGWLSALAPEAAGLPGAGERATAAVRTRFRAASQLDEGLSNCLRRAAATAVLQIPERVDPVEGQRAILADRVGFAGLLDRAEPALVAVSRRLDALGPTRGHGARLAPLVLEAFRVQAADVFPREDMGGAALAAEVVAAVTPGAAPARRGALERELAGLRARAGGPDVDATLDRAAQLRREASLLEPAERLAPLREAISLSRHGADTPGEVEGLDELSRAFAEDGRHGPAVAALGEVARLSRAAVDASGEARALQLAGRLLCEAPAGQDDPGRGLVMLLLAADIAASVDPVVADLVRRYVTGFQYTLDDQQFARIEPLLDRDRGEVVEEAFGEYRRRHREELP